MTAVPCAVASSRARVVLGSTAAIATGTTRSRELPKSRFNRANCRAGRRSPLTDPRGDSA